jgi:hypothetical protein
MSTDFYLQLFVDGSLIKQFATGINDALVSKKDDIFNDYVAYDRIQDNANSVVGAIATFNFDNTEW